MATVSIKESEGRAATFDEHRGVQTNTVIKIAIVVILALYFGAEAFFYTGLYATVTDWQIAHFDRSLPSFTFAVLYGLALSIALFVLALVRRRRSAGPDSTAAAHRAAVSAAHEFGTFLFAAASFAVIAAAVLAIWAAVLPGTAVPVRIVGPDAHLAPDTGPVRTIRAVPDLALISSFSNDFSLSERQYLFVPMIDPANPGAISCLVQVVAPADWNGRDVPRPDLSGTFQMYEHQVPGFLRALYRRAGKHITNPTKMLTKNAALAQFPLFGVSILILAAGVVVGIAGLFQRRHEKRLRERKVGQEMEISPSET